MHPLAPNQAANAVVEDDDKSIDPRMFEELVRDVQMIRTGVAAVDKKVEDASQSTLDAFMM